MVNAVFLRVVLIGIGAGMSLLAVAAVVAAPGVATLAPALVIAASAAAAYRTRNSLQLRSLEAAMFAAASVLVLLPALGHTAADGAAGHWRELALASAVLAFAYGALVPNPMWRAAIGVAAMAALPVVVLLAQASRAPDAYHAIVDAGVGGTLVGLAVAAAVALAGHALVGALLGMTVTGREADMYQLEDKIGAGGMGEIWKAHHRRLSRTAAIKIIRPERLCENRARAREVISRFELEAKSTARLRSPNTIEVYDFGTTRNGTFFYVMEYLDGLDLDRLVARSGPLPAARVLFLMEQVCQSLCDAHEQGLLHRDIKPANIFVSRMGSSHDHIKVLDFGLAREIEQPEDQRLSSTNQLVGTPAFMAPEMVHGKHDVDIRADVYAIGCVIYFVLTGQMVFEAANALAAAVAHAQETPEPPSSRTSNPIPADLEAVVMRCLAKDPADRYDDCHQLGQALRACADFGRWTSVDARRWWRANPAPAIAPDEHSLGSMATQLPA